MQSAILKIGRVILVWFCFTGVALADAVTETRQALEMWQPISIEKKDSTLIVVTKERIVTSTIYNAMIAGICVWAGTGKIILHGVEEITILNRFRATGRVFEGGFKACKRIANVPGTEVDTMIAFQTHMYACTSGRGCKY